MKKLYSIALAALTAVSALAMERVPRMAKDAKGTDFAIEQVAGRSAAKQLRKAPARVGATLEGLQTGERFVIATTDLENYSFGSVNIATGDTCDYVLKQFYFADMLDLPANVVDDPEFGPVLQIPGGGKVTGIQSEGDWKLYLCAVVEEDGQLKLQQFTDMDLSFVLMDGTLYFPYSDAGMMFYNEASGQFVALLNPYLPLANGTCSWIEFRNSAPTPPFTSPVYGELLGDGYALWICNAVELSNPIIFDFAEDGSAQADTQVVVDSYEYDGRQTGDFILYTTPDHYHYDPVVPATLVNNADGTSTLTWTGTHYEARSQSYMLGVWAECSQTFNFSIPTLPGYVENGVGNVTPDANAPVEYYNLQGVRVSNPAPGLYIRRHGTSVSKIVLED